MSGLEDLYREIILDHYRSPRNRGELPVPPARRVEGFNPLCGDEVVIYLQLEGDTVTDLRIGGQGCSISQSSASMMSAAVKGRTIKEARHLISSFKSMMSIHEQAIGEHGRDDATPPVEARTGRQPDGAVTDASGPGDTAPNGRVSDEGAELHKGAEPHEAELLEGSAALEADGLGELAALQGVVKFPVRIKCATLSWNALAQGLDEAVADS
ncbi:MAG: Fe-S cluster assembly sulfur transfer protein SufU [Acidimicrobiales bacterium]